MEPLTQIQVLSNDQHHIDVLWYVAFHPIKPMFASCGADKNILIWEYNQAKGEYIKTSILAQSHTQTIRSLAWDPSGTYLASASFDKSILIWKLKEANTNTNTNDTVSVSDSDSNIKTYSFNCINSLDGHDSEVKSISWSISGSYLASCSRDKTIWLWELDDKEEFICNSVMQGHSQDVKYVKWSPNEDILFSASFDNTIKVWGYSAIMDDWECLNTLTKHIGTVWCIDFNKKGDLVCSCSDDLSVVLWRIDFGLKEKYKHIEAIKVVTHVHDRAIFSIAFACDDRCIVTCALDNSIALIQGCTLLDEKNKDKDKDKDELRVVYKKINAHSDDINCVDCYLKGNMIVSCGDDSIIKLWRINL